MKLSRRTPLMLFLLLCLVMMAGAWHALSGTQDQIASVHSLEKSGAQICYHYSYDSDNGQWKQQGALHLLLQSLSHVVNPVVFSGVADVVIDESASAATSTSLACDDNAILNLQLLSDAQGLSLVKCKNITDTGIANAIHNSDQLKWVNFNGTAASTATISELAQKRTLVGIGLQGTPTTDSDAALLKACEKLEILDLSRTRITTTGFSQLSSLNRLRELDLSWTSINDDTIKSLSAMTHLDTLYINNTNVTMNGVLLLSDLPALKRLTISSDMVSESDLDDIKRVRKRCDLTIMSSTAH